MYYILYLFLKHFAGFTSGHMITESLKVWKNLIFNVNQDMTVAVVIPIEAIANQSPPLPSPEQKKIGGFRGM